MKRSPGVTVCAVVVILASAVVLLFGVLGGFGIAVAPAREAQPHFMKFFMWVFVALTFGAAGWGIATGAGLLQLKPWARISILLFSGLLLFVSVPALLMSPFMPLQQPPDLPDSFNLYMRIFLGATFGSVAGIGIWWMVYFTRKSVRAQFQEAVPEGRDSPAISVRPISIAIIGWYLIVSAFISLPFGFLHLPMFLLGFLIKGWAATVFMVGCGVFSLVVGIGLLKLKPWSRSLAIGYLLFFTANSILAVALPGAQARYQDGMRSFNESLGMPANPMQFPLWATLVFCLPLFAVLLWFLIAEKKAFLTANQISTLPG